MLNLKLCALGLVIALVIFTGKTVFIRQVSGPVSLQSTLEVDNAIAADTTTVASGNIVPLPAPVSSDALTIRVRNQFYAVAGATATEIRSQMAQLGPVDELKGRRFDARTNWRVQWTYQYARSWNQCAVRNPKVSVDVTILYPKWVSQETAPRSLRADWQNYMSALKQHEAGHKTIGINAGNQILQTLRQLPAASSCEALSVAANATAQGVVKQHNQFDIAYDRSTGHGATQGAIFPPTTTALQ